MLRMLALLLLLGYLGLRLSTLGFNRNGDASKSWFIVSSVGLVLIGGFVFSGAVIGAILLLR